jgi:hypothetical protein
MIVFVFSTEWELLTKLDRQTDFLLHKAISASACSRLIKAEWAA